LFPSDPNNPGAQPTQYMLQAAPDADFAAYGWWMGVVAGSKLVLVGEHGRKSRRGDERRAGLRLPAGPVTIGVGSRFR
jgi:hypothetical protein